MIRTNDVVILHSGGFRGGKGGANATPFGGYFCVHNCTSPSNDYAAVALGRQLGVDTENIDNDQNRAGACFQNTLKFWLKNGRNITPDAVITALESPTIQNMALAHRLETTGLQYCLASFN